MENKSSGHISFQKLLPQALAKCKDLKKNFIILYKQLNMSTLPIVFKDDTQLMSFAEDFIVKDRFASLENDVNRCLPTLHQKTESSGYAPFPAIMYCLYNKQIIAWKHDEKEPSRHLTVVPTSGDVYLPVKLGRIHCDAQYIVSIRVLKDDIKNSITRPKDGYLEDLKDNTDLQNKFVTAINQIYDPVITD
jgi:hypothetical protein